MNVNIHGTELNVQLTTAGRQKLKKLLVVCVAVTVLYSLFRVFSGPDQVDEKAPVVHNSWFSMLFSSAAEAESLAEAAEAAAQKPPEHAPVSEILQALWHGEAAAFHPDGNITNPPPVSEVLLLVSKEIRDATVGTFVGETALLHAIKLCLDLASDTPTVLIFSAPRDVGQVAYMVGTQHPTASVLTFHPTQDDLADHCRLLRTFHSPRGLRLRGILSAGTWCNLDLERFAATPSIVDVQLLIGTQIGGDLLDERVLHALLSLARWTLISLPLVVPGNYSSNTSNQTNLDPSTSSRDLLLRSLWFPNDNIVIDAEVASLGVVRVPATADVQALFLVRARRVERRTFRDWHHLDSARRTIRFTDEKQAELVNSTGDVEAEPSGIPLETLISLGLPVYERVRLVGLALITLEPSEVAGWLVCCGGLLRQPWPGGDTFVGGSVGALSHLSCTFGLTSEIGEMVEQTCGKPCLVCETTPLSADGAKDDNCIVCGQCVSQSIAPMISEGSAKKATATAGQVGTAALHEIEGYAGPYADDIPGAGDILNLQVTSLTHCATLCKEIPRCKSFEYSPTAVATQPIRNCQLASSTQRAGVPYSDFGLYLKKGGSTSSMGIVDSRLIVGFAREGSVMDNANLVGGSGGELIDHGQPFGTAGGGHQYGWLCKGIPTDVGNQYFSPDPGFRFDVGGFCGSGAVWQIVVPPGLYEVQAMIVGNALGNATGCKVQGAPLVVNPSLAQAPRQDHNHWLAAGAVEVDAGPLQITCSIQNAARLMKIILRRTWRTCLDHGSGMSWLPSIGSLAGIGQPGQTPIIASGQLDGPAKAPQIGIPGVSRPYR